MIISVSEQANSRNELRGRRRVTRGGREGGGQAEPQANQTETQAELGASEIEDPTKLGATLQVNELEEQAELG